MRSAILFLAIFYISISQTDTDRIILEGDAIRGRSIIKYGVFPRHTYYTRNGTIHKNPQAWLDNEYIVAYIYKLITEDSSGFDRQFPNSSLEEISHSLEVLKSWVKKLKQELAKENLWGFDIFPNSDAIDISKKIHIRQITALKEKIDELKAKRKKLQPPKSKLSIMNRCALMLKKIRFITP